MGEFFEAVEVEKVFEFIGSLSCIEESEEIDVREALGRVSSQDLAAGEDLPGFDRSTVDGYAVRSRDVFGASTSTPAILKVVGEIKIDEEYGETLGEGEALKVPTGGKLPEGADAVVMVEDTRQSGEILEVFKPVAPGQNVMRKDEDVSKNETVLRKGERITFGHISLLLNLGITKVKVTRRLKVGLISTGDEIIEPEMEKRFPFVRDSNTHSLKVILERLGFDVKRYGVAKDDFEQIRSFLEKSFKEDDVTVISGGSSVGVRDFTVDAINSIGKPGVVIHGVLISPGKPTIFGIVDGHPFVGLPGHPSSFTLSAFYFLVPLLRKVSCASNWRLRPSGKHPITSNVFSRQGRETLVWARRVFKGGKILLEPLLYKSGMVGVIAKAEGFLRIPTGVEGLYEGEEAEFFSIWEGLLV